MEVLTFIPGVGQLLSFIGSGFDMFLQGMSQLWNVNKMNNKIRLENANNEVYWNTQRIWDALMKKKQDAENKTKKDLEDRIKASEEKRKAYLNKHFMEK
jgi:hypothetical protein